MALAAFAALVPRNVLEIAPHGILNVHPSLLPRWRGAAPIQASILAGDMETGVTVIRLVEAMDAGPIVRQERIPILPEDDYLTLEPRLATLGGHLLVEALEGLVSGTLIPQPQKDAHATYCRRIARDDARIDWYQLAEAIWRQVRAYRGWPQAFTTWEGRVLKVLRATPLAASAACGAGTVLALPGGEIGVAAGAGTVRLDEVTLEGRKPQGGAELLRGYPNILGARLGT
jgi:methionyl-tRNA formyltransferase